MLRHRDYLTPSYLGGLFDGDGCLLISEVKRYDNAAMSVQLAQSVTNIIRLLEWKYNGRYYLGKKEDTGRQQYVWKVTGNETFNILTDLHQGCILKLTQVENCLEFYQYIGERAPREKNLLCKKNKQLNQREIVVQKDYSRINSDYIAGIFDAEGCFGIGKRYDSLKFGGYYLQISQSNHPDFLLKLVELFGFGSIRCDTKGNPQKWTVEGIDDIIYFLSIIEGRLVIKRKQFKYFKKYILSRKKYLNQDVPKEEIKRREKWFQICNTDKHQDRSEEQDDFYELINPIYENWDESKKGEKVVFRRKYCGIPDTLKNVPIIKKNNDSRTLITYETLTREDLLKIKDLYDENLNSSSIARCLGCERQMISAIVQGFKSGKFDENCFELIKAEQPRVSNKTTTSANNRRNVKDIDTLLKIYLYKFKVKPGTNKFYSKKDVANHFKKFEVSKKITWSTVKYLWENTTSLYENEFTDNSIISYDKYLLLTTTTQNRTNKSFHTTVFPEILDLPPLIVD